MHNLKSLVFGLSCLVFVIGCSNSSGGGSGTGFGGAGGAGTINDTVVTSGDLAGKPTSFEGKWVGNCQLTVDGAPQPTVQQCEMSLQFAQNERVLRSAIALSINGQPAQQEQNFFDIRGNELFENNQSVGSIGAGGILLRAEPPSSVKIAAGVMTFRIQSKLADGRVITIAGIANRVGAAVPAEIPVGTEMPTEPRR